ncbi:MAG: hypothetical protein U0984_06325 [Prosthecobacter sp.]|nr:hypothetical protein [Prosthecobacter sp.]
MPWQATSRFRLSRDYYEQLQSDWLKHISRWRRFTIPFGVALILIGLIVLFTTDSHLAIPLGFVGTGIFEIVRHFQHHRKWIRDRLLEKSFDHPVEIDFTDAKITIRGPQGSGFCTWDAFERYRMTPRGLFLWPRKGVHIYIPDSSLTPVEAKAEIAARIGGASAK